MIFESIEELVDFEWLGKKCDIIIDDIDRDNLELDLPGDYKVIAELNCCDTDDAINYCNYIIGELAKAKIRNSQKEYCLINYSGLNPNKEDLNEFREYIKQKEIWLDSFIAVMQSRMNTLLSYQISELNKH